MIEKWKNVPGYPMYEVSNLGRVRKGDKLLGTKDKRDGYIKVTLSDGKRKLNSSVHRVVAMTWISNPLGKPCINHRNCIRDDNRVENLEWCTYKENNNYGDIQKRHSASIMGHPKLGAAGRPMKAVLQLKDNYYIGYFESSQEAERKTGVNYRHISECCQFRRKSAGGFQWVRDLDYLLLISIL